MNITNARILLADGNIVSGGLELENGLIQKIGQPGPGGKTIDVRNMLVLPGIIDLHGDGFERHIMPRAGVSFSRSLGLVDTDRAMTANGITTAFHGLTYSWEPGLRGREAAHAFMEEYAAVHDSLGCDTRLHLRYETYNVTALDEIDGWLKDGLVDMLAFNDHLDAMLRNQDRYSKMSGYIDRTGLNREAFLGMLDEIKSREDEVPAGIERLAATARANNIPMASHDDPDQATRTWYNALGCFISEFPLDEDTARAARGMGDAIVLGAPNALRGKSHIDRLMARDAIRENLCDVLTSDYYYPAQLQAAFALDRESICTLPEAWQLISANPARTSGLTDRGTIEEGKRADLVIVDDSDPTLPRAIMTLRQGTPVFSANGLGY